MSRKKMVTYVEFGPTGHRPIWIQTVIQAFEKLDSGWHLNVWVPHEFVEVHKDWCRPYLKSNHAASSKINFHFHEEIAPSRISNGNTQLTDFEIIRRCMKVDAPEVCFIANKLDSCLREIAFSIPGLDKSKLVGIMDFPFLHYKKLASTRTRNWLSMRRFLSGYLKNLLVCHRSSVAEILMLDPLAPDFYNAVLRTAKYRFIPEYITKLEPYKEPRKFLNLPQDKNILLFIGPTERRKGICELLQATEHIYATDPQFRSKVALVIAGLVLPEVRGEVYATKSRIMRAYPEAQVVLVDRLLTEREFVTFMHAADVVCLPYIYLYGTSSILIQAAAAGRLVLSSDFGIVGELVRRYNLGVICDPIDKAALQAALYESIKRAQQIDMATRESLKSFAKNHAVSLESFGEAVCEAFGRVAEK